MSLNPELRRNLWLEATPARLVLVPAIVGGVLFLAYVSDGHRLGPTTSVAALVGLGVLTWAWGAHLASEAVLAELRGRTWDWQRMSGLGAWTLTWGKLAGATSPAWYGGALCLLVYAGARPAEPEGKAWQAALVVLTGVLVQAGSFLGALHAASRGRVVTRAQSSVFLIAGAVVALQVVAGAAGPSPVVWYGVQTTTLALATASVGAFAAFAVLGAWVRVRRELRIRTLSLAWPSFLLFVMLWAPGFSAEGEAPLGVRALVAFAVAVAGTWGTALLEPKDPVALRRLVRAARAGRWRTLAEDLPPWLLALPFVLGAWAVVLARPGEAASGVQGDLDARALTAAVVLFLARDVATVVFLALGARPRRADLLAVVLFVVGYVLVPLVLSASGLAGVAALFFPDPERGWTSAVAALAQALAAGGLLVRRWRARARAVEDAGAAGARG